MDIKSQLKEAREAINNKDFKKSTKICENILKEDVNNYLGLVFLGLSVLEINLSKQSENAFRRAIEICPDNLLAWNGLAKYYEKLDTTEARLELIKIYTFLIGKETTEKKLTEYCEKLCSLYKYTNVEEICKVIYEKVENGNYSEATLNSNRSSLANILKQSNELSDDILEVYEDILSSLICSNETVTTDYYSQYLMVLYKQKKLEKLISHVIKMFKLFPEDITCITWICKVYSELYIQNKPSAISEWVNIREIYQKLLTLEPKNAMAKLAQAICYVDNEEKDYHSAKKNLLAVVGDRPGLVHAWVLLTRINIILHAYNEAADSAGFASRLMKSPKFSCDEALKFEIETILMEALSRSSDTSNWEKAIERFEELDEKIKPLCLPHYTRANIKLGNTIQAKDSLSRLAKSTQSDADLSAILCAQLLRKQNKQKEALTVLERNQIQSSEWWLELGITYWEMKEFDKCLSPLLKAAKSDPNNYYCFFYLGQFYRYMKEYDKARRCFERSFKLCPNYNEASIELSKMYRILQNWDANIALLQTITEDQINKQNLWAWLQMGLILMEQGDYDEAINYLRSASRIDKKNSHCWESLGDAYLCRGAYASAQEAYEVVLEISNLALYPALQIALIKKDRNCLDEAILDFEALLTMNSNCVLTLTGLAETCLRKARVCYYEQRLGTARDYAQYAVESVTRAIRQCSEISCLWKILGDCCMLVTRLPEKYCCLMIMRALDEGIHVGGDKILEKDDLFQLAAKCYCKALILIEDKQFLWHDLAVCYLNQAENCEDRDIIRKLLTKAQAIIQNCTLTNPRCWQHWNLLGNIALASDPPNYALAQHAFIKAVILDNDCAIAWCNLGILYYKINKIELANKAFAEAQRADPNYTQSWIGKAFVAEIMGQDDEAIDLFRHSISLGFHPQGALGYGHWVCRKLMESPQNSSLYAIQELHAIPVACDALTWYTERDPYDCCAWNMLGILKERMGIIPGAAECFKKALNLSTARYSDLARINCGRVLTKLGLYKVAIKICSDVQESSFHSGIWYALALYKDGQFQESSSIYLAIAQRLAKDKCSIGDVIACMAIITYVGGEPELAKTIIIESFNERLPTARVIYALIALGVLEKDTQMVALALKQIDIVDDVPKSIEDFITLLSYVHIYQGNHIKAIRKASELVHLLPDKSGLWLTFALTLLRSLKYSKSSAFSASAVNKAAKVALELRDDKATHRDISKIHCTISSSSSLIQDHRSALISAQKAVHCTPDAKECWLVLNESLEFYSDKYVAAKVAAQVLSSPYEEYQHIRFNSIF